MSNSNNKRHKKKWKKCMLKFLWATKSTWWLHWRIFMKKWWKEYGRDMLMNTYVFLNEMQIVSSYVCLYRLLSRHDYFCSGIFTSLKCLICIYKTNLFALIVVWSSIRSGTTLTLKFSVFLLTIFDICL